MYNTQLLALWDTIIKHDEGSIHAIAKQSFLPFDTPILSVLTRLNLGVLASTAVNTIHNRTALSRLSPLSISLRRLTALFGKRGRSSKNNWTQDTCTEWMVVLLWHSHSYLGRIKSHIEAASVTDDDVFVHCIRPVRHAAMHDLLTAEGN